MNLDLHQYQRPSPHSYVMMVSHVSFLLPIVSCWRKGLLTEALGIAVSLAISFLYHMCDEQLYCSMNLSLRSWHFLDVWSAYMLVCVMLGVYLLQLPRRWANVLRVVYIVGISGAMTYDRFAFPLTASLLFTAVLMVVRYRSSSSSSSSMSITDTKKFLVGMMLFVASFAMFVIAGQEMVGARKLHVGDEKPDHLPDTTLFWVLHSVWHSMSMIALHYLVNAKQNQD